MSSLSGSKQKALAGHEDQVSSLAWSRGGAVLASGSYDKSLRLWQVSETGQARELHTLGGHGSPIEDLDWLGADETLVVSASSDGVKLWDARAGRCAATWKLEGKPLNLACRPDGRQLAVADRKDSLSLLDVRQTATLDVLGIGKMRSVEVNEISWNAQGSLLFLTATYMERGMGGFEVVDSSTGKLVPVAAIGGHMTDVFCLKFSKDGEYFAVGGKEGIVTLWNAKDLACVGSFSRSESALRCMDFSGDGKKIAYGSSDRHIAVDDVLSQGAVDNIDAQAPKTVECLAWHPSADLLAFAISKSHQEDKFVRLVGTKF